MTPSSTTSRVQKTMKKGTSTAGSTTTPTTTSTSTSTTTSRSSTIDWSIGTSTGWIPGRAILGPMLLMMTTPCISIIFVHVNTQLQGNLYTFVQQCTQYGLLSTLYTIWPTPWNINVWKYILLYMGIQLLFMKYIPGKLFHGNITPTGHVPIYKANGMACYVLTLVLIIVGQQFHFIQIEKIYDYFGEMISSLNILAWLICTFLFIKGHVAPTSTDTNTNQNFILDFFGGIELYPRVYNFDMKQITNCRCGMMFWSVALIAFCYKNQQINSGLYVSYPLATSVMIQLFYISKFFYWEMGYMCSMDIQHDRAGYYLCWGCLVWVPAVYTSPAFYMVAQPMNNMDSFLIPTLSLLILILGWVCVYINYESDHQRYIFRQSKGQCLIWGHEPKYMIAHYQSYNPLKKTILQQQSLLLLDGWWSLSRHFHYVPEIAASFFWSVPSILFLLDPSNTSTTSTTSTSTTGTSSLFTPLHYQLIMPFFYVVYLTILLSDRAYRDDNRCRQKYGPDWDIYCQHVPYKILPGIV